MACSMPQSVCFVTEIQNWSPERIYLLEIQTVVVFVFGWVGRDGGGKCVQSGSSKTVTHCLDTVITKGIYNTCVCDMLNTTKMNFKVFLTVFSYRLQWHTYNRSEWGQSVNIKILRFSSTTTRCKQCVLTWFYVKENHLLTFPVWKYI